MKIGLSDIVLIIVGVSGWVFHFINIRMNRKYKSVEYLDVEIKNIAELRSDLKNIFDSLRDNIKKGNSDKPKIEVLYRKALNLYYKFFNVLERMCGKVQYGVVDIGYFEKQVGENICTYADVQISYVIILKKLSEKLNLHFGLGQRKDTFKNFYQVVASRETEEKCLKLNRERRQVGLPSYNRLTQKIEWSRFNG